MPATLTTLRISETIRVRARTVNSDGTEFGPLASLAWTDGGHTDVVADSGDGYLAYLTGVSSTNGAAATVAFEGMDVFSSSHVGSAPVAVLNASRFKFSIGEILLEPGASMDEWVGVSLAAFPWDVREDPFTSDIYPEGSPGVHDIAWSSANGAVLFGGPLWASPPGTPTAADTLSVEVWADVTEGNAEPTTDVITVTALNSNDEVIQGSINVVIRRVASVTVEQADE